MPMSAGTQPQGFSGFTPTWWCMNDSIPSFMHHQVGVKPENPEYNFNRLNIISYLTVVFYWLILESHAIFFFN
jgi:predicted acylesterase/phospholipase RssA